MSDQQPPVTTEETIHAKITTTLFERHGYVMEKNGTVNGVHMVIDINKRSTSRGRHFSHTNVVKWTVKIAPHWSIKEERTVTYHQSKTGFNWDKIADQIKHCYDISVARMIQAHAAENRAIGAKTKRSELIEEFGLSTYSSIVEESCGAIKFQVGGLSQEQARALLNAARQIGVKLS